MSLRTILILSVLSLSVFSQATPSKSKGIIKNSDGTYTILEPRILRGNKKLPLFYNGTHSLEEGLCKLFNFDHSLIKSSLPSKQKIHKVALLRENGSYYGTSTNKNYVESIVCYNSKDLNLIVKFDKETKHRDGSVTLTNPRAEVAGISDVPFGGNQSNICKAFGFEKSYDSTASSNKGNLLIELETNRYEQMVRDDFYFKTITCFNDNDSAPIYDFSKEIKNKDGSVTIIDPTFEFGGKVHQYSRHNSACQHFGYSHAFAKDYQRFSSTGYITQLACYNLEEQKNLFEAVDFIKNPDGSTTIITPRIYRGGKKWPFKIESPISNNELETMCDLYGFDDYLFDTAETLKTENTRKAFITSLLKLSDSNQILKEFTCFNNNQFNPKIGVSDLDEK